jgi:hypothetical protein
MFLVTRLVFAAAVVLRSKAARRRSSAHSDGLAQVFAEVSGDEDEGAPQGGLAPKHLLRFIGPRR